jgi:hypothetical protein
MTKEQFSKGKENVKIPERSLIFSLITLDNKFQKSFCICDEYAVNVFVGIY